MLKRSLGDGEENPIRRLKHVFQNLFQQPPKG